MRSGPRTMIAWTLLASGMPTLLGATAIPSCHPDSVASLRQLASLPLVQRVAPRLNLEDASLARHAVVLQTSGGWRVVATLSWGGPDRGLVFLLDCNGHMLSVDEPGFADSLRAQDVVGDGVATIVLWHEAGTGTGWRAQAASIYRVVNDSLQSAWIGRTFEGSYANDPYEIRGMVAFPSAGVIVVTSDSIPLRFNARANRYDRTGKSTSLVRRFLWSPGDRQFSAIH